jgi:hypothetical protein
MSTIIFDPYKKVPLGTFLPKLTYALQTDEGGIDEDAASSYVVDAAIDIATRTKVLRREIHIKLQACVDTYRVDPQDCVDIIALMRVCYPGRGVIMVPRERCNRGCSVGCGPVTVALDEDGILHLSPAPSEHEDGLIIALTVAVAPTRDACEVDELLYTKYAPVVVLGALVMMKQHGLSRRFDAPLDGVEEAYERRLSAAGVDRIMGRAMGPFKMKGMKIV